MAGSRPGAGLKELERLLPAGMLEDQLRLGWRVTHWLDEHRGQTPTPRQVAAWIEEARASVARRERRAGRLPAIHYPVDLPIAARREELLAAIQSQQVLVVAGETGSGKTTQLPKLCLEAGLGVRAKIACTQPRRVAALALSRRVAEELGLTWGEEVGCKIRFTDRTSPDTFVKFMTDGMLLAEAQGDPLLSEYEAIVLDEAHERSLNIDFLIGLLKNLILTRHDLRLIVTSATIDTQAFAAHFGGAPVIEVSGRVYPVSVQYRPLGGEAGPAETSGADAAGTGEVGEAVEPETYVEAAVTAVLDLVTGTAAGDVLVFMPSERDIRETCDLLAEQAGNWIELVPLFGRLSNDDQQRVFAPSERRRVVVATNIAETSLTVPRIRYVVDTGLARVSRYNARTRTKRLPIEPISQSSANQRTGRCGRVGAGVCLRLFGEADFAARPRDTQPEIQRANLAEVILRMKAFGLGDIETFPFLNPPAPAAIQAGYRLLQELGALDQTQALTELGGRLARLPVDPTIGRMILQAGEEGAVSEVLAIAAGLSIQDPRERPADRPEAAKLAHRRFQHPRSDFLTLLNIWQAYHAEFESLRTHNQMRRFCRAHFLSFPRMREWRDLHAQLEEAVAELGGVRPTGRPASYEAVHRSIATGLWGQVGLRKERNLYQLGGGREAMAFPGSGLFERTIPHRPAGPGEKPARAPRPAGGPGRWVVAGEIVETSRVFLRTLAEIAPEWILELAPHLVKRIHREPHWDAVSGRVLVREKCTLNGLPVSQKRVAYATMNAGEATEIFIRAALIEGGLEEHLAGRGDRDPDSAEARVGTNRGTDPARGAVATRYGFLDHNRQLQEKIAMWQAGRAQRVVADLEEALGAAYRARLSGVSSVADLNRALQRECAGNPRWLWFTAADLLGDQAAAIDRDAFPETVAVGDRQVSLRYQYAPGEEADGVTVRLPFTLAQVVNPQIFEWAVPGLREPRILHLLQALPKELRRALMPLAPKAQEMAAGIDVHGHPLAPALSAFVAARYGIAVPETAWNLAGIPAHLRPRYELVGANQRPLAAGRDLGALRNNVEAHDTAGDHRAWEAALRRWERYGLREWTVGEVPERVVVTDIAGLPLWAYPALEFEAGEVSLRLFRTEPAAQRAHGPGVIRLVELAAERELAWAERELRGLVRPFAAAVWGTAEEFAAAGIENLKRHALGDASNGVRTAATFAALAGRARGELPVLVQRLGGWMAEIEKARCAVHAVRRPYPQMAADVQRLLPRPFVRFVPFERVRHLARYLKAVAVRAERAAVNPAKDAGKQARIQPLAAALERLRPRAMVSPAGQAGLREVWWLLEELRVSVFAQELGTAEPVSVARVEQALAALEQRTGATQVARTAS
jgi:ATP-dependent helicase HrpA